MGTWTPVQVVKTLDSHSRGAGLQQMMARETKIDSTVNWLALFATTGTLVCCAIPIMLVTLGMGATVATLTRNFPLLITLSQYKTTVFIASGLLLGLSGWLLYRPGRACPTEPRLAEICNRAQLWNRRLLWSSTLVWGVGFFAAYLALPLRLALGV